MRCSPATSFILASLAIAAFPSIAAAISEAPPLEKAIRVSRSLEARSYAPFGTGKDCCYNNGQVDLIRYEYIGGNEYAGVAGHSAVSDCAALCDAQAGCAYFSHSVPYNACMLCSDCTSQVDYVTYTSWKLEAPTESPTKSPTGTPTDEPTKIPTEAPTRAPTDAPSKATEPSCLKHSACTGPKQKCKGHHKKNKKCRESKVDCKLHGTKRKTRWSCDNGKSCTPVGTEKKWGKCQ